MPIDLGFCIDVCCTNKLEKQPESANLHYDAILSFVESHILFHAKITFGSQYLSDRKFGEAISPRPPTVGLGLYYDMKIFSATILTLNLTPHAPKKLIGLARNLAPMLNTCAKNPKNRTCTFREIANERNYERKNQLTNKLA